MSAAREAILGSVRGALESSRREHAVPRRPAVEPGPEPGTPPGLDSRAARVERFRSVLEGIGGGVTVCRDLGAAARAFDELLRERDLRSVATSDGADVADLIARLDGLDAVGPEAPREELLEAEVGLSSVQHAIAETGTLVLESEAERHRLVSLLPQLHVAILRAERIQPHLGAALAAIGPDGGLPKARTLTFITGPSRTADIELTLVVGVHGPRALHVLLIDSESPA